VPLSSTQAVIGAVIGVGIAKGGSGINYKVLGKISTGWIAAPAISCMISFVALFFVQNVFEQKVININQYQISETTIQKIREIGIRVNNISDLVDKKYSNSKKFKIELITRDKFSDNEILKIFTLSKIDSLCIDTNIILKSENYAKFSQDEINFLKRIAGKIFIHQYDLLNAIDIECGKTGNNETKKLLNEKKELLFKIFRLNN
jgi:inorganic phosphate transporter, PiT family